jgi:protein-L-isoaspartate(D-aspartate) O-methyltransferase
LAETAQGRLAAAGYHNVEVRVGDGTKGWPEQAPYERVIVTAAAAELPAMLVDRLAPGGVLLAPLGEDHRDQQLVRVRRSDNRFVTEDLGTVRFVPLVAGLPRPREAGT